MQENLLVEICLFARQHVGVTAAPGGICSCGSLLYRWRVGQTPAAGPRRWVGMCYSWRILVWPQQKTPRSRRTSVPEPLGITAGLNTQMAVGCYLFILPPSREGRDGAPHRPFLFLANIVICCSCFSCKNGKLFSLSY